VDAPGDEISYGRKRNIQRIQRPPMVDGGQDFNKILSHMERFPSEIPRTACKNCNRCRTALSSNAIWDKLLKAPSVRCERCQKEFCNSCTTNYGEYTLCVGCGECWKKDNEMRMSHLSVLVGGMKAKKMGRGLLKADPRHVFVVLDENMGSLEYFNITGGEDSDKLAQAERVHSKKIRIGDIADIYCNGSNCTITEINDKIHEFDCDRAFTFYTAVKAYIDQLNRLIESSKSTPERKYAMLTMEKLKEKQIDELKKCQRRCRKTSSKMAKEKARISAKYGVGRNATGTTAQKPCSRIKPM